MNRRFFLRAMAAILPVGLGAKLLASQPAPAETIGRTAPLWSKVRVENGFLLWEPEMVCVRMDRVVSIDHSGRTVVNFRAEFLELRPNIKPGA